MTSFIDAHIIEHQAEYQQYCNRLYKGRYLADDLFQEFYLLIRERKESVLKAYDARGTLTWLCKTIIRELYYRRGRRTANGQTPQLQELCNPCEVDNGLDWRPADPDGYNLTKDEQAEKLHAAIAANLRSRRWFNTKVFLLQQGVDLIYDPNAGEVTIQRTQVGPQTINKISKGTRIDRAKLTTACRQAAAEIRRYVDANGDS